MVMGESVEKWIVCVLLVPFLKMLESLCGDGCDGIAYVVEV